MDTLRATPLVLLINPIYEPIVYSSVCDQKVYMQAFCKPNVNRMKEALVRCLLEAQVGVDVRANGCELSNRGLCDMT